MADNEQRRTCAKVWGAKSTPRVGAPASFCPKGSPAVPSGSAVCCRSGPLPKSRRDGWPWLAVSYGFGIVVYFTADREPGWWAAVMLALAAIVVAILARRRVIGFPLALGFAASAAGFATATLRTEIVAHPVLHYSASSVTMSGFVEIREERERSDRITVRVHHIESSRRLSEQPDRVRLAVRKNTAPAVGSFIELKAHLSPPLAPLRPGGYDFARDMYFQSIGASGYALGQIKVTPPPVRAAFWLHYAALIDSIREAIDKRIRAVIPGDEGSIASALITGKRDAISTPVNDAMYISSLAHVLSISGYHMAVVAGIVFFFIRAGLALVPLFASRYPIKKWAAAAALSAAAFYLLLSGAEVATQRSFIMIAIVLFGILVDRPTLTFRTITIATFGVLLLAPESVVQPSFQMSFAATLALIAAYQHGLPWRAKADTSLGARVALWGRPRGVRTCAGVVCGGPRHHALCLVPFPSRGALRRDRQPAGHAGGFGGGDADGDPRRAGDAVRVRCDLLETDGRRHRLDG
jgi:competence protein ComEC